MLTSLVVPIFAFAAFVFMGAFIFFRDTSSKISRLYSLLCLGMALYTLLEIGYRSSRTYEEALLWWNFDIFWPLNFSLWVHFVVLFTNKARRLSQRLLYALIYGPAIIFIISDIIFNNVTGPPVEHTWGWYYGVDTGLVSTLAFLWIISCSFVPLVWLVIKRLSPCDIRYAIQLNLVIIGALIVWSCNIGEYVLRSFSYDLPPLVTISFLFTNAFIGYAIWKYELFSLTPERAARTIISTMNDALMLVDLKGEIISVNEATTKMLGYKEDQLVGFEVKGIIASGCNVPVWLEDISRQKRPDTFTSQDIETAYQTISGSVIPVSLSGSMLHDEHGNLRGFLLIARDITERKKIVDEISRHKNHLEELVEERTSQLSSSNKKLQKEIVERLQAEEEKKMLMDQLFQAQKLEAIGRLAGGIAHDFNNLLFVINGYSEALLTELDQKHPFYQDISEIFEAGNRAVDLTGQLLAFSRKQAIEPVVIDMYSRIESSKKMLSRLIGEDIFIDFKVSTHASKVLMDKVQFDQILANLVVNSRDAMPNGGKISITTDEVEFSSEEIKKRGEKCRPGRYVMLSVKDNGCGIPKDNMEKIFEPFYTSKEVGKGTGLGLAMVYGIVKQNEGFIEVDSHIGKGTLFKIFLPSHSKKLVLDFSTEEEKLSKMGKECILLVEDNHMVRRLTKRQLEKNGYRVIEAFDGSKAVSLFNENITHINLVLTDVVMPRMSGRELVEKLKTVRKDIKIIFMSGHNDEIINRHGINTSGYPFISKPFTHKELSDKIREVFDRKNSGLKAI